MKKVIIFLMLVYLMGSAQNQYITVSWEPPAFSPPISGYITYLFPSATDTLNPVDSISVGSNVFEATFTGLSPEQVYYFRIIATNAGGRSPFSDVITGYIMDNQNISVNSSVTTNTATISWSSLDQSGIYLVGNDRIGQVKFSTDSLSLLQGSTGTYSDQDSNSNLNFSIHLSGLQSDTKYYYFLFENDTAGNLVASDILSFQTDQPIQDPDANEPNNNFEQATNWNIPGDQQGYIFPSGDEDFFVCNIPAQVATFSINAVTPTGENLDLVMDVYNSNQQLIETVNNNGVDGNESLDLSNPASGLYYVTVRDNNNQTSVNAAYQLQGDITFQDPDPNEPNNSFDQATTVNIPGSVEGYIYPVNDPDYYTIAVPDSVDTLTIITTPPTGAGLDLQIELFDNNRQLVSSVNDFGQNSEETLQQINPGQAQYYILITDAQTGMSISESYFVQIRLHFMEDTTQITDPDPYEPNNMFSQAKVIYPDSIYTAYTYPEFDNDYYIVSGFTEDKIAFEVMDLPFPLNSTFYESDFTELGSIDLQTADSVHVKMNSGGYIQISPINSADFSHRFPYSFRFITIQDTVTPPPIPDEKHYFMGPNPLVMGKSTETGFYFQNVQEDYTIAIFSLSLEKVWEYKVEASDGQQVIWSALNQSGNMVSAGVYLAVVRNETGKVVQQVKLVLIK